VTNDGGKDFVSSLPVVAEQFAHFGMKMKLLENWEHDWFGVWRMIELYPQCPRVEEVIGDTPLPDTDKLLDYLKTCPAISAFATTVKCMLCDTDLPLGKHSDGVLIWPLDLPHYIAEHGVLLPDRFVNHIRSMNYVAPSVCGKRWQEFPWPSPRGDGN
jgi:hypothetical protein